MISSSFFCLSSSPFGRGIGNAAMLILSRDASKEPMLSMLLNAAAEGLSKFMGAETVLPGWPLLLLFTAIMAAAGPTFAGDFLICCGDDLGPWGEKAAWRFEFE